jgi:predicted nucleotidyltransferase
VTRLSSESRKLREHARDLARQIVAQVGCSVALTGSAARGDAERGSDIDLWLVGRFPDRRDTILDRGRPVTLLRQPLRRALSFRNLCFWEVRDLLVLEDASGAFAKITGRFAELAPRIDAAVLGATFEAAEYELRSARADDVVDRVRHLRGALHRLAAAWVFKQSHQRVPRLRQFKAQLPAAAWSAYRRGAGLKDAEDIVRRALRAKASAQVRADAREKLDAGRAGDALLILRRQFDLEPAKTAYGRLLHGVNARTEPQVVKALLAIRGALSLDDWAPRRTLRLLDELLLTPVR